MKSTDGWSATSRTATRLPLSKLTICWYPTFGPIYHGISLLAETDCFVHMSSTADRIEQEIKSLADADKLRLVDAILADLDRTVDRSHLGRRIAKAMGSLES
jgi:hypothetical protein